MSIFVSAMYVLVFITFVVVAIAYTLAALWGDETRWMLWGLLVAVATFALLTLAPRLLPFHIQQIAYPLVLLAILVLGAGATVVLKGSAGGTPGGWAALAGLFAIVGAMLVGHWWDGSQLGVYNLACFLPTAVFLVAYAVRKATAKPMWVCAAKALALGVLFFWGLFAGALELFSTGIEGTTDARSYEWVLRTYWIDYYASVAKHFPQAIPDDAHSVRFHFQPAFLQGGANLQLRYSTTTEEITRLYEHFSGSTLSSPADTRQSAPDQRHAALLPSYRTGAEGASDFPPSFEFVVLYETDSVTGHGQAGGVAISRERNEIVYWAHTW